MLRLSRKMRFALEAVIDIAYNSRSQPVQARDITERQGIPQRYLEQVMQHLVRAGLLKGVRGPKGGYHLARERRRITVGDIVRLVEQFEQEGTDNGSNSGSSLGGRVILPMLEELQEDLMARLDDISIQDLCDRARKQGVPRSDKANLDFTI